MADGINVVTLGAARKYTQKSLEGGGALKGKDGFSPIVSAKRVEEGMEISIQDSTHTETFVIKDGTNAEGTTNYDMLENRPQINDTILESNKSFEDLGMVPLSNMEIMQIISKATNQLNHT